jgi:hypothetical protein
MNYFQTRRSFLWALIAGCTGRLVTDPAYSVSRTTLQESSGTGLKEKLLGSWELQSYTYTSNNRTFSSPDEMEGIANFTEEGYDANFSTYISAVGIKRTRRKSESGTFSVNGSRIRLLAEEASEEGEKGEEFLIDVRIEGDTMTLTSNNRANNEVWKRIGSPS